MTLSERGSFKQLGFVVKSLASGQMPYLLSVNSNKFLEKNYDTSISVFFEESFIPCMPVRFARFNLRDALMFYGDLIATSVSTAMAIKDCTHTKRFFYINDLENLRRNDDNWNSILKEEGVIKFTRSKDYYDILTEQGYKIHQKIVPDFAIEDILEITNAS